MPLQIDLISATFCWWVSSGAKVQASPTRTGPEAKRGGSWSKSCLVTRLPNCSQTIISGSHDDPEAEMFPKLYQDILFRSLSGENTLRSCTESQHLACWSIRTLRARERSRWGAERCDWAWVFADLKRLWRGEKSQLWVLPTPGLSGRKSRLQRTSAVPHGFPVRCFTWWTWL